MVLTAPMSGARQKDLKKWEFIGTPTGTTHYHAHLDFSDKGRAIKGLVVCPMLLNLISMGFRVPYPITIG